MNEIYDVDMVVVLRCGMKATIVQERTDDGYYLFWIHTPQEIHRLSEWNILTHIANPTWSDYGLVV